MGGRGGGSAISRERMLQDLNALMREQSQLGPEQQVQRAIQQLHGEPGRWVDIADVRDRVALPRSEFDALIRRMSTGPNAVLIISPEENQKTLTPHRRAGGLEMGNQIHHIVTIRIRRQ